MATTAQVFGNMPHISVPDHPVDSFDLGLIYVPGAMQNNALRNRAEDEAALPITQAEMNKFIQANAPLLANYPPQVRDQMIEALLQRVPKWNPKTDRAPKRPLTPSSSAVRSIKIRPDNNIDIQFGSGQTYTYRGGVTVADAAREVLKLINARSIGHELGTKNGWGAAHHI